MNCPQFSLLGSDNESYTLANCARDSRDTKVLLFVYPKDNTPGCTTESKDFSALESEFLALGIRVIGVSPDSVASHQKFIQLQDLSVLLLSDPEKKLIEPLGAWGEKKNYGKTYMGIIRSTFLIDIKTQIIEKEWRNVRAKGHAERVLKELSV